MVQYILFIKCTPSHLPPSSPRAPLTSEPPMPAPLLLCSHRTSGHGHECDWTMGFLDPCDYVRATPICVKCHMLISV